MLTHTGYERSLVLTGRGRKHEGMAPSTQNRPAGLVPVLLLSMGMILSGTIGYSVVESGWPPAVVVFWRCVIGAAALLAITMAKAGSRRELRQVATSGTGLAVAASGVLLVANWVLIFTAYEYLSIGVATVVFHVEPFLLIGLGALFLDDRITGRTFAWAVLGFSGIVLVAQPWAADPGQLRDLLVGVGLTLTAASLYAASIIIVRRVQAQADSPPSPLVITAGQLLVGAVVTSPVLALIPHKFTGPGWAHLLVLGLMNTALMYMIIYAAYPGLGTATIGVLSFIYPAAAVVVDFIAYGIVITMLQILGFAAITGAGIGQVLTDKPSTPGTSTRRRTVDPVIHRHPDIPIPR